MMYHHCCHDGCSLLFENDYIERSCGHDNGPSRQDPQEPVMRKVVDRMKRQTGILKGEQEIEGKVNCWGGKMIVIDGCGSIRVSWATNRKLGL